MIFLYCSAGLNLLILVLSVLGSICMFKGIHFTSGRTALSAEYWRMFQYFTVDSNILMGICSTVFLVYEIPCLRGSSATIPDFCYTLKLTGTVGVTLTFLVVIFFLAPNARHGYLSMFQDSNLFFHLIIPVLSMICFALLEKTGSLGSKDVLISMIPMGLYAIFYAFNALGHAEGDQIPHHYDFYGFLARGKYMAVIVLPVIIGITFLISEALVMINRA